MTIRFRSTVLLSVGVVCFGLILGCGQKDQAGGDQDAARFDTGGEQAETFDPHDVPITDEQKQQLRKETANFADAVSRIKAFRDAIQEETKDGLPENPFEAHQALDRVDLVVQWLPGIARDSGVPKEQWETINTAANELRELFEKVHQNIDNRVDPDFASFEEQIDAKIAELQTIAESQPAGK